MTPTKTPEKVETVMDALESAPETKALHLARLKWAVIDHWLPDNPTIEQRLNRCLAEPKKMIWHAIDLERDRDQLRARVSELEAMPKDHVIDRSAPLEAQLAQAEAWLVQMRNSYVQVQMTCNNMEVQRDAATEALKRARVAIEKAPHPSSCDGWRAVSGQTLVFRAKRCDCWKAAALAAAETEK